MGQEDSLSGMKSLVEQIIWINNDLAEQRLRLSRSGERAYFPSFCEVRVPAGHRKNGVEKVETYNEYRRGLECACADIVVCTRLPDGKPAVLASKRAKHKPCGEYWWMQGGAIQAYRSVEEFVAERAEKECGVRPTVEGLIGVFRICAEDLIASTLGPCYVGSVPFADISGKFRSDGDHTDCRIFTFEELADLPKEEVYWYPRLAFKQALLTVPY